MSGDAVGAVDEVLEAPRRSHKGLVAAVSPLNPKGPRALGGLVCVYTRSGSQEDAACRRVGGLLDVFQKVGEITLVFETGVTNW